MRFFRKLVFLSIPFLTFNAHAQDLMADLPAVDEVAPARASFKNSKVINAQSLETTYAGNIDFRISHRFGELDVGSYELLGVDQLGLV